MRNMSTHLYTRGERVTEPDAFGLLAVIRPDDRADQPYNPPRNHLMVLGKLVWRISRTQWGIYEVGVGWHWLTTDQWRQQWITLPPARDCWPPEKQDWFWDTCQALKDTRHPVMNLYGLKPTQMGIMARLIKRQPRMPLVYDVLSNSLADILRQAPLAWQHHLRQQQDAGDPQAKLALAG